MTNSGGDGDDTLTGACRPLVAGAIDFPRLGAQMSMMMMGMTDFTVADGDKLVVDTTNGDETTLSALGISVLANDAQMRIS